MPTLKSEKYGLRADTSINVLQFYHIMHFFDNYFLGCQFYGRHCNRFAVKYEFVASITASYMSYLPFIPAVSHHEWESC